MLLHLDYKPEVYDRFPCDIAEVITRVYLSLFDHFQNAGTQEDAAGKFGFLTDFGIHHVSREISCFSGQIAGACGGKVERR